MSNFKQSINQIVRDINLEVNLSKVFKSDLLDFAVEYSDKPLTKKEAIQEMINGHYVTIKDWQENHPSRYIYFDGEKFNVYIRLGRTEYLDLNTFEGDFFIHTVSKYGKHEVASGVKDLVKTIQKYDKSYSLQLIIDFIEQYED